ncbi:MAG: hypothetical protein INQ03_17085 [Candidatus Heimdallarchaeota archaeon]|nr:hypothetical protein [Candidatus Heimdallarchaeota archaeon]
MKESLIILIVLLSQLLLVNADGITIDFEDVSEVSGYGFDVYNRSGTMDVKITEDAKYSGNYGLYFFSDPVRDHPDSLFNEINFDYGDNIYIGFAYYSVLVNTLLSITMIDDNDQYFSISFFQRNSWWGGDDFHPHYSTPHPEYNYGEWKYIILDINQEIEHSFENINAKFTEYSGKQLLSIEFYQDIWLSGNNNVTTCIDDIIISNEPIAAKEYVGGSCIPEQKPTAPANPADQINALEFNNTLVIMGLIILPMIRRRSRIKIQ